MPETSEGQVPRASPPGGCASGVEVTETDDGAITVRHRDVLGLGVLSFTRGEWDAFIRGVKDGEFDVPAPRPEG